MEFCDLKEQYRRNKERIDIEISKTIETSAFILGPQVKELEEKLSQFVGVKHAIGVSSGTDALVISLMALDVKPEDEIITSTFSFIAAAEAIAFLGAKPVFADIDPWTFNVTAELIEKKITEKTRGIIPVDLFGQCANYDLINEVAEKHGLFVIEDAAQAMGAEYKGRKAGSLSKIGCTSFFPAKTLGCYGDGGMIFTNDDVLAEIMKSIRVHGKGGDKYDNVRIGMNGRLDTLQAAVLLGKLPSFFKEISLRQNVAHRYSKALEGIVGLPRIEKHNLSSWAQYCIFLQTGMDRDAIQKKMKDDGIPTAVYYPRPLHLQTVFKNFGYKEGDLPVSEGTSRYILALPMYPFLTLADQKKVVDALKKAVVKV
jgi:UDP-2-acetamido-2-deoxy-ribo-hexuluronate aminotransferase